MVAGLLDVAQAGGAIREPEALPRSARVAVAVQPESRDFVAEFVPVAEPLEVDFTLDATGLDALPGYHAPPANPGPARGPDEPKMVPPDRGARRDPGPSSRFDPAVRVTSAPAPAPAVAAADSARAPAISSFPRWPFTSEASAPPLPSASAGLADAARMLLGEDPSSLDPATLAALRAKLGGVGPAAIAVGPTSVVVVPPPVPPSRKHLLGFLHRRKPATPEAPNR